MQYFATCGPDINLAKHNIQKNLSTFKDVIFWDDWLTWVSSARSTGETEEYDDHI